MKRQARRGMIWWRWLRLLQFQRAKAMLGGYTLDHLRAHYSDAFK